VAKEKEGYSFSGGDLLERGEAASLFGGGSLRSPRFVKDLSQQREEIYSSSGFHGRGKA